MAGKKHHHVWQLIQRGFATKRGRDHEIWVYSKDGTVKKTVTRKFGVEKYFFSEGEDTTADDNLTAFENDFQENIHYFRDMNDGQELPIDLVHLLISHLEIRSQFIRAEASVILDGLIQELENLFKDKHRLEILFKEYLTNNPQKFDEYFRDTPISEDDRDLARMYFEANIDQLIHIQADETAKGASTLFLPLIEQMANAAKKGHLQAVSTDFSAAARSHLYDGMCYTIRESTSDLILPDTGLAFRSRTSVFPFSQKGSKPLEVIVPLSTKKYIYGSRDFYSPPSTEQLIRILASCSYNSFIAVANTNSLRQVARRIGKNAKLIYKSELRRILDFDSLLNGLTK